MDLFVQRGYPYKKTFSHSCSHLWTKVQKSEENETGIFTFIFLHFWNEHKSIIDPRILYNESLYATLILLSLLINKEVILGVKQSGENELAYKQMEERFQIMIRNYGTASKENFLHIFEAILFVFLNNIKNENYASRRKRKNKNLNKISFCLSNIREEDIIEYLIIMMHRKLCFDEILNI